MKREEKKKRNELCLGQGGWTSLYGLCSGRGCVGGEWGRVGGKRGGRGKDGKGEKGSEGCLE